MFNNDDDDDDDDDSNNNIIVIYKRYINILNNNIIKAKYKRHKLSLSIHHYYYYKLKKYYNIYRKYINNKILLRKQCKSLISSSLISLSFYKKRCTLLILLNNTNRMKYININKYRYKRLLSIVFGAWLYQYKDDINNDIINNNISIKYYNNNIKKKFIKKLKSNNINSINSNTNNDLSLIFLVLYKLRTYIQKWYKYNNMIISKRLLVSSNIDTINTNTINMLRYFNKFKNIINRKISLSLSLYYKNLLLLNINILNNNINNIKIMIKKYNDSINFYTNNILYKYFNKLYYYKDKKDQYNNIKQNVNTMYIERTLIRSMRILWEYADSRRTMNVSSKYETLIFYQLKLRRSIHKWYQWYQNKDYSYKNITMHQKMFRVSSLRRALVSWLRYLKRRYVMIPIYQTSDNHNVTFWRHRRISSSFINWLKRLKSKRYQRLRAKRYYHNFIVSKLKEAMGNFKKFCTTNKRYKRYIVKSHYHYESRRFKQGLSKLSKDLINRQRNSEIILRAILFWKLWREDNYMERWKALVAHRRFIRASKLIPEVTSNVKNGTVENIIKDGIALWQEKIMFIDKSERTFHRLKAVNQANVKENEDGNKQKATEALLPMTTSFLSNTIESSSFEYTPSNSLVKVPPRTLPDALSLPIPLHSQKLSIPFNLTPTTDYNKLLFDTSIAHFDSHRNSVLKQEQSRLETELKRKQRLNLAKDIIKFVSEFKDIGLNLGGLSRHYDNKAEAET